MEFAPLLAVWDYFDVPRSGVALVRDQACYFRCEWNAPADDYADTYVVHPLDSETLSLALEQWAIFKQWERAFHAGEAALATHPANPGQSPRYSEIDALLKTRVTSQACIGRFHVQFQVRVGQGDVAPGVMRELEASWRPVV